MAAECEEIVKLKQLDYFHPDLDRHKAECILLQNGQEGTFLIRNSSQQNEYVVSVRAANAVKHFQLFWKDSHFLFGHGCYETFEDLYYHFSNKPTLVGESGIPTLLVNPYPRTVSEPAIYDTVVSHAESSTAENNFRKEFSINSKDGYLTKLGSIFKTWHVRWFVLKNNELKYFKNSADKGSLRILDLDECRECKMEEAAFRGKTHVFKLVFDWRTFYMFAASEDESKEWVRVINWRMKRKAKE